jgi:hypothetical protein
VNTDQKIIKNKVGVLKLAEMLGSVSQACKMKSIGPRAVPLLHLAWAAHEVWPMPGLEIASAIPTSAAQRRLRCL